MVVTFTYYIFHYHNINIHKAPHRYIQSHWRGYRCTVLYYSRVCLHSVGHFNQIFAQIIVTMVLTMASIKLISCVLSAFNKRYGEDDNDDDDDELLL